MMPSVVKKILIGVVVLLGFNSIATAQLPPPYWGEVRSFEEQDKKQAPPEHPILFIGSSSFTKWTDVQDYFPGYVILNRAFGGSTLQHQISYCQRIIEPYHPKQVVIYCGENDLAYDTTVTGKMVLQRFEKLFGLIRQYAPGVPIVYVSIKPSPSRKKLWGKMRNANTLIKNYLTKQKNAVFVNVFDKMMNVDGTVKQEIFTEDNLHMNAKGYEIWKKSIQRFLLK